MRINIFNKQALFSILCIPPLVFFAFYTTDIPVQAKDLPAFKIWIFLDEACLLDSNPVPIPLDERTRQRTQAKGQNRCNLLDNSIPGEKIQHQIKSRVQKILFYSRALRAYSAIAYSAQIPGLKDLPCVKSIEKIGIYKKPAPPTIVPSLQKTPGSNGIYGNSHDQLQQLNIPEVHATGYTGSGVRIAIIDAGFYKQHTVFQHILNDGRLIAERDFVFNDKNVQDETTIDTTQSGSQHSHGTSVWSLIGGYEPGVLIGAAYNAEFLLAKSEYVGSETIVEEDWYVQAVEWAEAMGADIISTSVAYRDFDNPEDDHGFEDLDGKTTPAARVINWVFERGVLPVICAGNSGNVSKFADGGLLTPSDAIGALTVGAVDADGSLASFSSHGPTSDGRIKPDLCAMGVANYVANANSNESYTTGSGTSYSTPLIAGAAALLLEKHPHLTPVYLMELMKAHATRANTPGNQYGWGIPDIYAAIIEGDSSVVHNIATERKCLYTLPNPSNSDVSFLFQWSQIIPSTDAVFLKVYNLLGEEIWSTDLFPHIAGVKEVVPWNLKNFAGEIIPSGMYIVIVRDGHTTISGKCFIYH